MKNMMYVIALIALIVLHVIVKVAIIKHLWIMVIVIKLISAIIKGFIKTKNDNKS